MACLAWCSLFQGVFDSWRCRFRGASSATRRYRSLQRHDALRGDIVCGCHCTTLYAPRTSLVTTAPFRDAFKEVVAAEHCRFVVSEARFRAPAVSHPSPELHLTYPSKQNFKISWLRQCPASLHCLRQIQSGTDSRLCTLLPAIQKISAYGEPPSRFSTGT